jgi:glycosyltransferase involved in cell wall biosynthesis
MGKKGFFGKIVEKGIFRLTDNYICVSKLTESNLLENRRPKNIEIIANGVNTKKITYLNPSDKFSDVLYAGRLIPEKHVELLVKAMNKVTDIHPFAKCFIVGEGPSRIDLERLVSSYELEDNVIFMDFLDNQEDLYSLMKSSTVFVLPSEREGFGIVLIEANACGLPVITINNPMNAAKDLITSDNGCVINNNVDNLAKIINFYIEEGLNRNMRNNCRTYAKKFDWDHITSITENYYSDILKI